MRTARLETFSDGVIAIAATLLILDVRADGSPLGEELRHIWPSYLAYAISFLIIGIIWVNHHVVMDQIERVDRRFLFLNVFFLMVVAFIPFPTELVAHYIRDGGADARDAVLAYGCTFTLMAIGYGGMWWYAAGGGRLLRTDANPRTVAGITRSFRPGAIVYGGATLLAFVSPVASLCVFAALAIAYVVENEFFARSENRA